MTMNVPIDDQSIDSAVKQEVTSKKSKVRTVNTPMQKSSSFKTTSDYTKCSQGSILEGKRNIRKTRISRIAVSDDLPKLNLQVKKDMKNIACPENGKKVSCNAWATKKCNFCEKSFWQNSHINRHVRIAHDQIKPYLCSNCNYSAYAGDKMERHTKRVHPYKCNM